MWSSLGRRLPLSAALRARTTAAARMPTLLSPLRFQSSGSADLELPEGGLRIGNPKHGTVPHIRVEWTDIVGQDTSMPLRINAGRVLAMMDMCAARATAMAADLQSRQTGKRYLTCTVGVTNTQFSCPILFGDAVRIDARVVHCGESSLGVHMRFFRQSPTTRREIDAGETFFSMVTITPDLRAAKIVPSMILTDPLDIALHKRYQTIRATTRENEAEAAERRKRKLTVAEVDCPINRRKQLHVPIKSTVCRANRIFFSAFLNNNNTVFGGELMSWMEQHAIFCGRMFIGHRNVFTIGMHSVAFPEPVYATDWVTLEASVAYVRNTTMEVDVVLRAERKGSGIVITNRAAFVLISMNDIGQKAYIPVGLDLENASQEELHSFMEAKTRYIRSVKQKMEFYKQNPLPTPPTKTEC